MKILTDRKQYHLIMIIVALTLFGFFPAIQAKSQTEENGATSLIWSPDGNQIAISDMEGNIKIWDTNGQSPLITIVAHAYPINSLSWHPANSWLASGSEDTTIKIWDVTTGENLDVFTGFEYRIYALGWNPAGDQLAGMAMAGDPNFIAWDVDSKQVVFSTQLPTVKVIAWSPDGKQVALGNLASTIDIRDTSTYELQFTMGAMPHDGSLRGESIAQLAWSPDGKYIVTGSYGLGVIGSQVILWDVALSRQEIAILSGHEQHDTDWFMQRVVAVWFNADGSQFSSLSGNGTLRTWNLSRQLVKETFLTGVPIYAAALSPDGTRLAYSSKEKTLEIIEVDELE